MNTSIRCLLSTQLVSSPFLSGKKSSFNIFGVVMKNSFSPFSFGQDKMILDKCEFRKYLSSVIVNNQETKIVVGRFKERYKVDTLTIDLIFRDCVFYQIQASFNGGAIYLDRKDSSALHTVSMIRTKFYQCSTSQNTACIYCQGFNLVMNQVCASGCFASSNSFLMAGNVVKSTSINSTFAVNCYSTGNDPDSSCISLLTENITMENLNCSQTSQNSEACLIIKSDSLFLSRYVQVEKWSSAIIFAYGQINRGPVQVDLWYFNFINNTASDYLISVNAYCKLNNFGFLGNTGAYVYLETKEQQFSPTVIFVDSMIDQNQVNTTHIRVLPSEWDRSSLYPVSISIGYGPTCYDPSADKSNFFNPNSFWVLFMILLAVFAGIGFFVVFILKKPRIVEENTELEKYELIDKIGETKIIGY